MSFFTHNTLYKAFLISCSMAAVLSIVGCNKTDKAADSANIKTTTATSPTTEDPEVFLMTTLALATVNDMFFDPLIQSEELSAEQKTCLNARDKNLGATEIQAYYNSNFTPAELQELNEFYASDTGEKMLAYGNEQMRMMNGEEISNPMSAPSEDEMIKLQEFMQSPLGVKNMQLNNAEGAGSVMETLTPTINAEFKRCHINLDMSSIM